MWAGDWYVLTIAGPGHFPGGWVLVCLGTDVYTDPDLHTVPVCASCTRVGGGCYGLTLGRGARCACLTFLGP
ncbi:hypothetical protein MRX96_055601 [Rhipicephalus microplus]